MENPDKLLTPREVADIIQLDFRTLANWRASGAENLKFLKIGGRVRYDPEDVNTWLDSKRAG